jgi:hypothetical protein
VPEDEEYRELKTECDDALYLQQELFEEDSNDCQNFPAAARFIRYSLPSALIEDYGRN